MSEGEEDRRAVEEYRRQYGGGPFLAVDAVVTSNDGYVLLVRRSGPPQKGRLALPGGFLGTDETLLAAALRELEEETGLRLSSGQARPAERLLRDAPGRDPRARIVSVAFHFPLTQDAADLPVKGADDAADASWMKLDASMGPDDFYADHYGILQEFGLFADANHQGR